MDFDVARHGVALKTVVPTCPFARFRYGIGRDEGPSRARPQKERQPCKRSSFSRALASLQVLVTEALLRAYLTSKNGYK